MAANIQRLRLWLGLAALAVVAVVGLFYGLGRWRAAESAALAPAQLEPGIEQATEGFTLSRSEGGRTLFTVRASQAIQFRQGGRAELKDVSIIVYGRRAERLDRISGSDFLYDPETAEITARGEVEMELEAPAEEGGGAAGQPPRQPIHLKTSGLVFNHKTGFASTREAIEFRLPGARGAARGATYDSTSNVLTLEADVWVETEEAEPVRLTARQAAISATERQVELRGVRVESARRSLESERVLVELDGDLAVRRLRAESGVRAADGGAGGGAVRAARAEAGFAAGGGNRLAHITLSGGVEFNAAGAQPVEGRSQRLALEFAAGNRLARARAQEGVRLRQAPAASGQQAELTADGVEFHFSAQQAVERAVTSGAARIVLAGGALLPGTAPGSTQEETVVTAGRLEASFRGGRLRSLYGSPEARVVARAPGRPERVATSRQLTLELAPTGALVSLLQEGDFRYREGQRTALAQRASFDAARGELVLTGAPRVQDGEGGMTASADRFRLQRQSGDLEGEGEVKVTYSAAAAAPGGALLGAPEPVHVTAPRLRLEGSGTQARFSGGARLWQGANIVQAPTLEFDRAQRSLTAQGTAAEPVSTVFVQPDAQGRPAPVNLTAARLRYSDGERRARFEGGVTARGAGLTVTAAQVDVFLHALGGPKTAEGAGRIERLAAGGGVMVEQPGRRATGERLVYTSEDGKFVLSGGSPSIFDAERGTIRGDSLTFFSRDDRVLVGSEESSSAVTQTRVPD